MGAIIISDAASLAIHGSMLLAERPDEWIQTTELAARLSASRAHVTKVMQRLTKAGITESARGSHGGFRFIADMHAVTLLDVYEAIEGRLEPPTCLLKKPICGGRCSIGGVLRRMNVELRDQLASTSLADLMARARRMPSEAREEDHQDL
ncbi:MAG: Rrf2 family transcriptional regulator [candidate division WS1 bacterium]|jgi:Rrf2 family protein|nr:Rrf2 family transcriptional regulator [candidate division WS1 bacterium]